MEFTLDAFVTLSSEQIERLVAFYRDFLLMEPTVCSKAYAEFELPGLRLAIFTPKAAHAAQFANSAGSSMSLCLEVCDLAGAIAHLTAIGHTPPDAIMHTSHGQEVYAYDPDGNRLILHQAKK
ncbi:MAG: VOC family protein [Cyanobacteria bacterium J06643_4]